MAPDRGRSYERRGGRRQPYQAPTATGMPSVTHASASPSPPSLNSADTRPMQVSRPSTIGQPHRCQK